MKKFYSCVVTTAILLLPAIAFGQRSGEPGYIEGRLTGLRQQLADLSARIKHLEVQDQQLQQRLETMRTNFEARLGQLESGSKGKAR